MKYKIFALVLLAMMLWACGGGGGGGNSGPSPFEGTFAGTWNTGQENGTANLTIAQSGNVTGSIVNNTFSLTGTVDGNIQNDGDIDATYQYQGQSPISAEGTLTLSNNGNTLSGAINGGGQVAVFTLTRQ